MKDFRQLFGNLVPNPHAIENATFPIREEQERVLAIITSTETDWLGSQVYTSVSTLPNSCSLWAVESLAPIPLVSAETRSLAAKDVRNLIAWLTARSLRGVFITATIAYGTIGHGTRFAHGSTGPAIPILLESSISLDRSSSWADNNTATFLSRALASMEKVQIHGTWFYRL